MRSVVVVGSHFQLQLHGARKYAKMRPLIFFLFFTTHSGTNLKLFVGQLKIYRARVSKRQVSHGECNTAHCVVSEDADGSVCVAREDADGSVARFA